MSDFSLWMTILVGGTVLAAFGGFASVLWKVQQQHHALIQELASLANERGWSFEQDGEQDSFYRLSGIWSDGSAWLIEGLREDVAVEGLRVTFPAPSETKASCLLIPRYQDAWAFDPDTKLSLDALCAAFGVEVEPTCFAYLSVDATRLSKHYLVVSDSPELFQDATKSSDVEELLAPWMQRLSPDQLPLLSVHPQQAALRFLVPVQDKESILEILALARRWYLFWEPRTTSFRQ